LRVENRKETAHLSSFFCKTESISLSARGKGKISINYLPLQLVKQGGVIVFTNESIGEFVYYLEGTAKSPELYKVTVDESAIDLNKIKLIKSTSKVAYSIFKKIYVFNNLIIFLKGQDDPALNFRCFVGDRVQVKLLVPIINIQREKAIITATKMVIYNIKNLTNYLINNSILKSL
jgi:hypothetical protein